MFSNSKTSKNHGQGMPPEVSHHVPGYQSIGNYIIGDATYPLTPYCIKECQSCSKYEEFNPLNASVALIYFPNTEKQGSEKTLYLDTFQVVTV